MSKLSVFQIYKLNCIKFDVNSFLRIRREPLVKLKLLYSFGNEINEVITKLGGYTIDLLHSSVLKFFHFVIPEWKISKEEEKNVIK